LWTTLRITPFKTNHGPSAAGSVGYVFEEAPESGARTLVYTSDFLEISCDASVVQQPRVLIIQSHWLNEPLENRPYHMSFQRALEFIREWNPLDRVYLVHVSDGDQVPGDPCNGYLKKYPPRAPMTDPVNGSPYAVPRCASEWQTTVDRIRSDYGISVPIVVASDGMVVPV
jgi:phosphoribosyl 1,2-cyclic phosphate phosphodiesterase